MRNTLKIITTLIILLVFIACSKNEDDGNTGPEKFNLLDVEVKLPEDSDVDLNGAIVFSLSTSSDLDTEGVGKVPFNSGSHELAYLMDKDDNLLMAGFLTDDRKEISMETTAEVILYFGLDYYLLSDNLKEPYLDAVKESSGFSDFVAALKSLFVENSLMYTEGAYLSALNMHIESLSGRSSTKTKTNAQTAGRIFTKDKRTKSGVTVQDVDESSVLLQNSYPRRGRVFVYKKTSLDRNGNETTIDDYTSTPFTEFELEAGKISDIEAFKYGFKVSQINAQSNAIENTVSSAPIELPVGSNEYSAGYEFIVIGSGDVSSAPRELTALERAAYQELTKETYILDYFLPTLLDVGGNKGLLPPPGDEDESALVNAVLPFLEANAEVLQAVKDNDFKTATELFLPKLYGDVRLSNDLRIILENVYKTLSNNGNAPNTFVQSQELLNSGHPRLQKVLGIIFKNMDLKTKGNLSFLRTDANAVEDWLIKSIDADVNMSDDISKLCLGQSAEIRVGVITEYEPDFEEVEFHWRTSGEFKGRIQDINDNPTNFGTSIITKTNSVSYISAALESELGSGDNIETIEVIIYMKDKKNGQLSEVGRDSMTVNHKICVSFYVGFEKEVEILEREEALICQGNTEYTVGHPTYVAKFSAVENAKSYKGKIKRKDGTFGDVFAIDQIVDNGDGVLEIKIGVGPIRILKTCNFENAQAEQQKKLDYLDEVGHQGIEVEPVF